MKGIFTKEQLKALGQLLGGLIDFTKVIKNKVVGQLAESADDQVMTLMLTGINDMALDKLPEHVKEQARSVADAVLEGNFDGVPEVAAKAIASLNGISEYEDKEIKFAKKSMEWIISGVDLAIAIKRSKAKAKDDPIEG